MDRRQVDALVRQFHGGRLDRRQFLTHAVALGLSPSAAAMLARTAGAQEASPSASPAASPIASPAASGYAMTSITREEYWRAVRQAFPLEQPARPGGTLVYGGSAFDILNPLLTGGGDAALVLGLVFDALVTVSPLDGSPAPGLADYWERSDDGLVYTFHLNPDATWHDGVPLTAADVVFSFRAVLDPDSLSPAYSTLAQYLADVRAVDDHTVELVAKERFATFVENTAMLLGIVPRHIWEPVPLSEWGDHPGSTGQDPRFVVGSGPFRLQEFVAEDHVTVVKRADHWDPNVVPTIDEFIVGFFAATSTSIQAFEAGEIDIAFVESPQVEPLRGSRPEAIVTAFDTTSFIYYIPIQDPARSQLFVEIPVRQALMYALDRPLLAERVYRGFASPAIGTQPILSAAYRPEQVNTVYNYDPTRARQLLEGAGWTAGADGIREKEGVRFSFECLYVDNFALPRQLLAYMRQAWREVGVDVTPVATPIASLGESVANGTFTMAILAFVWGIDGAQGAMFHCNAVPPRGFNAMRYCNPRYDELDTAQALELDPARRIDLLTEASNLVNDEAANGILMFRKEIYAAQPHIHNFRPNGYQTWWSLPFVWVET